MLCQIVGTKFKSVREVTHVHGKLGGAGRRTLYAEVVRMLLLRVHKRMLHLLSRHLVRHSCRCHCGLLLP